MIVYHFFSTTSAIIVYIFPQTALTCRTGP